MADRFTLGWKLDRAERESLLERFPPRYPHPVADHVTLMSPVPDSWPLPPPVACEIVGESDDGAGVQAMVVRVDGTAARPDGSTYHITWSLDRSKGREAVESNTVIAAHGWSHFETAVPVTVTPSRWPSSK